MCHFGDLFVAIMVCVHRLCHFGDLCVAIMVCMHRLCHFTVSYTMKPFLLMTNTPNKAIFQHYGQIPFDIFILISLVGNCENMERKQNYVYFCDFPSPPPAPQQSIWPKCCLWKLIHLVRQKYSYSSPLQFVAEAWLVLSF